MRNVMILFPAASGPYRCAIAARRSTLAGHTVLVTAAPTITDLHSALRYERTTRTIPDLDAVADVDDLREVAADFFSELSAAVAAAERRRREALDKAEYWETRIVRYTAKDEDTRTADDRRRLADAIRHRDRHLATAASHRHEASELARPWLAHPADPID
ncbi:MAG: hypothetical protein QM809_15385 [Gordonia sp. (in: high G+C Gram-positive bacteria)]|uniref:hypothetical protein n=1 Tax=Gordonia sp. (in: high G+C Gram-positive bacteria) TaxID=84139 RepID=UPI0039E38B4B